MTQRPTLLRIASPCAESWAAMTPTSGGRHCVACQKTVVDFTQKTDAEILATLRQTAGETCGRLRSDQLGRPLVAPAPAPRWRAWLGAALALGGVLGAGRAAAQASQGESYYAGPRPLASPRSQVVAPESGRPASTPLATPAPAASGLITLRGLVQDATTHEGLPGATVLVKGTNLGVSTDATGAFVLVVEASGGPLVLTCSYVGYVGQESLVTPGTSQPLVIGLAASVMGMMDEVAVVAGGLSLRKPWPWHPRRFFNWGKYWMSKQFRG